MLGSLVEGEATWHMIRKAWVLCCYTPLGRIQDFLVISFREQWWFLWKDLTGISQLWLSSSPNFHIHPLQNKISIVFALSKFVRHEMVATSIPISSCFFLRFPKCVKSVILWMWIWLKDCQGEQSSLSFMKKTSQTDEESFSNYGVWEQVSGERDSTLTFMSMRWYLWNWSMGPPSSSNVYWIYFNSFSFFFFFFFFFFLTDFVVVVPE